MDAVRLCRDGVWQAHQRPRLPDLPWLTPYRRNSFGCFFRADLSPSRSARAATAAASGPSAREDTAVASGASSASSGADLITDPLCTGGQRSIFGRFQSVFCTDADLIPLALRTGGVWILLSVRNNGSDCIPIHRTGGAAYQGAHTRGESSSAPPVPSNGNPIPFALRTGGVCIFLTDRIPIHRTGGAAYQGAHARGDSADQRLDSRLLIVSAPPVPSNGDPIPLPDVSPRVPTELMSMGMACPWAAEWIPNGAILVINSYGQFRVACDLPPAVARVHQQDRGQEVPSHLPCDLSSSRMVFSGLPDVRAINEVTTGSIHGQCCIAFNLPGLPHTSCGLPFLVASDLPPVLARVMHQQDRAQDVPDIIRNIASHLWCEFSLSQMARSSPSWAGALRQVGYRVQGVHAKLPWLQMPKPQGPIFFCVSCAEGDIAQHMIHLAEEQRWARYVSAFEGFWTLLACTRIGRNMIFNLRSGASFLIPDQAVHQGVVRQLLLLASALSSAPDTPNCIGMAIIKYMANLEQARRIVFFTPGSESAVDHFPEEYLDEPEDATYHDGSFWLLTANEHVHCWQMALHPDGDIRMVNWTAFHFPDELDHGDYVLGRFLVPSRGEFLMVVWLSACGAGGETTKFRIYKMTVVRMAEREDDPVTCRWDELPSLAGRMLFIGRGCSRCYEASDYPGLTEGVYFCDGRRCYHIEDIVNNLDLPCSDIGRWSRHSLVGRIFPQEPNSSTYSSSGWVLQ